MLAPRGLVPELMMDASVLSTAAPQELAPVLHELSRAQQTWFVGRQESVRV